MVLATRLKLISILTYTLFSSGCNAEPNNISDAATLNKHRLELMSTESKCVLVSQNDSAINKTELLVKPPCYFARKENSDLLTFSYPDKNVEAMLLVIGDPISIEKRKKWNLDDSMVCGESRQAVYFSEEKLSTSSTTLRGGLACKDTGIDEKDFYYFSTKLH